MATILDGRATAAAIKAELQAAMAAFAAAAGRPPCLAAVDVGGDAAAQSYLRAIRRACDGAGLRFRHEQLAADAAQADIERLVETLSGDAAVDGIILQMPLPAHIDGNRVVAALDPAKDVDGLHPINLGRLAQGLPAFVPATPAGAMELLHRYDIPLAGRHAVVVGRSAVVGKPMALLLLQEHATVTICHSRTPDLSVEIIRADLVAVAVGQAGLVTGAMIKPGAIVIDFGINVGDDGSLRGDVEYESAAAVAGAITPVPGGTGPMTNLMLLRNTLRAAQLRAGL